MSSGTKKVPLMADAIQEGAGMPRLLQLDLHGILKARIPAKAFSKIPRGLIRGLERVICQDELNRVLREAYPLQGSEFAAKALELLGVKYSATGLDNIPTGRYVFASNHPLGGLDGLALISVLEEKYGRGTLKFPVNDMLMNVTPLAGIFTPLNKYGSQGRTAAQSLNDAFRSDAQIAMFPAGLVSRIQADGSIADLKWQKTFVAKALESRRGIVPVYIEALNRRRFYNAAKWRRKLGLKINLEQVLLPGELTHSRGMEIKIRFGNPVTWKRLSEDSGQLTPAQLASRMRLLSDGLKSMGSGNR